MIWVWARHGNTFGPTDTVVYAGQRNDLPLVAHGIEQAHRLADAWLAFGVAPSAIYCGTLLRLRQTADIVCARLKWPKSRVTCDVRLDELDYGAWTGQTRAHVVAQFGEASVLAWEQHSIWPTEAGWAPTAAVVQHELQDFVREAERAQSDLGPILAISSNGRLRYVLSQVPNAFASHLQAKKLKVRTGHVGVVRALGDDSSVLSWDAPPAVALNRVGQHGTARLRETF